MIRYPGLVSSALVGILCPLVVAASAAASLITDFRVYGTNSVVIGQGSRVLTLDVGSNTSVQLNGAPAGVSQVVEDVHSGSLIRYQGSSGVGGNLYAGGLVRIGSGGSFVNGTIDANSIDFTGAGSGVTVGGNVVYATTFTQQANGIFGGTVTQGVPTPPDLPVFPAASVFSAGGPNVSNPGALAPGTYGAVSANTGVGLQFSSGNYYMDSLSLTGSAQMSFDVTGGPINLYIVGNATLGSSKNVSVIGGDDTKVRVEIHGDWTHGGGGTWNGTIFAPNGLIHVGSGSSTFTYNGYMWARDIDIEHSATISGGIIPEPGTLMMLLLGSSGWALSRRRGALA